jgi:hypothetical protein
MFDKFVKRMCPCWSARSSGSGYEGAAQASSWFKTSRCLVGIETYKTRQPVCQVSSATGQLLPGVGRGPLAPGAEHPEVAIKVGAFFSRRLDVMRFACVGSCHVFCGRMDGAGHEEAAQAGSWLDSFRC